MAKYLTKADKKVLRQIERSAKEENWESGTLKTFSVQLVQACEALPSQIDRSFLQHLATEIEERHRNDFGRWGEFHDLAYQGSLAELISLALSEATKVQIEPKRSNSAKHTKRAVLAQIDTLLAALNENLESIAQRRNAPPALDLALSEDAALTNEVRLLAARLEDLRMTLARSSRGASSGEQLAVEALRSFVLKLSNAAGTGLGHTITWGTRAALAWFAISILGGLGVPVDALVRALLQGVVPK